MYCAKTDVPETGLRCTGGDQFADLLGRQQDRYVISGPADRERLETVTKAAYEQLDKTGTKKL